MLIGVSWRWGAFPWTVFIVFILFSLFRFMIHARLAGDSEHFTSTFSLYWILLVQTDWRSCFCCACAMAFRLFVCASVCFSRRDVFWRFTTHSSVADGRTGVILRRAYVFLTLHCHALFPQINALIHDLTVQVLLIFFCLRIHFWKGLQFPSDEITELAPEAVKQWQMVAATQCVSWQFIMWMEVWLSLAVLVLLLHSD